ncbi:Uncharacterized protein ChrSV_2703 [Chromobacterium vaccinii]|nr:Uncharacterized protein ChrSW_2703 [Chromobacterium vaccinii]QND90160.1 Uncharacterized protein ChrSV_2703 [Chromobacterium vaccinii]
MLRPAPNRTVGYFTRLDTLAMLLVMTTLAARKNEKTEIYR